MDLERQLQQHFGYESFRPGQKEVIQTLLTGKDVIAMLPTGTGKSICYQLPALLSKGTTLVVSPLLSLMEDQVQQLRSEGIKSVIAINSFMSKGERETAIRELHKYKIIYLSPEMLQVAFIQKQLEKLSISFLVIDEAHCISQWGPDFRPDYLKLGQIKKLVGNPPCLAITATATKQVQEDIRSMMVLDDPTYVIYSVDRPEIIYRVEHCETVQSKIERIQQLVESLNGPGMIYFSSRMWSEKIASLLKRKGVQRVAYYHGGLATEDRLLIQQQFMNGQIDVICCTSAFGMGINKKDIRYVLHFHYPVELESYVQEVGRAARDGRSSVAILLYCDEDRGLVNMLLEREKLSDEQLRLLLQTVKKQRTLTLRDEQMIVNQTECNDISWRTIRYHLEATGVLQKEQVNSFSVDAVFLRIREEEQERYQQKQKNLELFLRWIRTNACRRERLLLYFSEELKNQPMVCCDNCGAILEDFYKTNSTKESIILIPWKETLIDLFGQADKVKK
ncbi:RecQ family ATP-dependent DNA helicase [Halalkalibacter kiskunsagensis]|uniref:ATP-dependent DNA helicase RecQ n=1 Tax=Halalkalibacter kiskunsagensis TaxID=1548599 RepID=A0ABV6KM72_9BACI